jgi:hypothetical protein
MRRLNNSMPHPKRPEFIALAGLLLAALVWSAPQVEAAPDVVVHLRNGDRITGRLLAQETNQVIIATRWSPALVLPIAEIGGLQSATGQVVIATSTPPAAPPAAAHRPVPRPTPPPATAGRLRTTVNLGIDLMSGAKDRQLYYGRVKGSFEKPYQSNPKHLAKASADYQADYGETDGLVSANRMLGGLKADFDFFEHAYCYGEAGGGYDEVRRIDLHYEAGPGVGYHLLREPPLIWNLEGGLNYQSQVRSAGGDVDSLYFRAAESLAWKLADRVKLTKSFEFFLNTEDAGMYRFRLDSTLSYSFLQNLSLNLTVLDSYDTDPAPTVDRNEIQFRSSLGITF